MVALFVVMERLSKEYAVLDTLSIEGNRLIVRGGALGTGSVVPWHRFEFASQMILVCVVYGLERLI